MQKGVRAVTKIGAYALMMEAADAGEYVVCLPIARDGKSDVIVMSSRDAMEPFDETPELDPMSDEPWIRAAHALLFAWECRRRRAIDLEQAC